MSDKWDFIVVINDESDPVEALVIPTDRSAGDEPKFYRDYGNKIAGFGARSSESGAYVELTYRLFTAWLVGSLFNVDQHGTKIFSQVRWVHDTEGPYVVVIDVKVES